MVAAFHALEHDALAGVGAERLVAREAGVRHLVLFHHCPTHGDDAVDEMLQQARDLADDDVAGLMVVFIHWNRKNHRENPGLENTIGQHGHGQALRPPAGSDAAA